MRKITDYKNQEIDFFQDHTLPIPIPNQRVELKNALAQDNCHLPFEVKTDSLNKKIVNRLAGYVPPTKKPLTRTASARKNALPRRNGQQPKKISLALPQLRRLASCPWLVHKDFFTKERLRRRNHRKASKGFSLSLNRHASPILLVTVTFSNGKTHLCLLQCFTKVSSNSPWFNLILDVAGVPTNAKESCP